MTLSKKSRKAEPAAHAGTRAHRNSAATRPASSEVLAPDPTPIIQAAQAAQAAQSTKPAEEISVPVAVPRKNPLLENFTPDDSLDSKKQFFRQMAEKIKEDRLSTPSIAGVSSQEQPSVDEIFEDVEPADDYEKPAHGHSVGLYRKIAIRFLLLAVVLVVFVFYFSFTKLTVYVKPNLEQVSDTLMIDVYGGSQPLQSGKALRGQVTRIDAEEAGSYPATGEKSDQGTVVNGKVKLINTTAKNQPLVATTRLLSSDNKLFRLKNTVNVPANSSIEAEVYADKAGADMAIAPSKFTIPGLWEGLQDKIYAESSVAFLAASSSKKIITQADIDNAKTSLSKSLAEKIQARASASSNGKQVLAAVDSQSSQIETDSKVGDEKDSFDIKVKNIATLVSFDINEIKDLVRTQFTSASGSSKVLGDIADSDLSYSFDSYNASENIVTMKVAFSGRAASDKFEAIDRSKIVNLSQQQLEDYLKNIKEVSSFSLEFFPSFIKKAPNLADRITIVVRP